jgi:hypothetical protein
MLSIILTYGVLGVAAGFFTNYFVKMLKKESNIGKPTSNFKESL